MNYSVNLWEDPSLHLTLENAEADTMVYTNSNSNNASNFSDPSGNNSDTINGIPKHMFDPRMRTFQYFIHMFDLIGVPIIVSVGILGNTICFFVFMATYLRRMSSSIYLAALSVCDALFLITTLCAWLDNVQIDVYHRPGWCQILTYLGFVTSFLDVWFVVSFTVERYLAICFPFQRQELCSPRRAKIVVISLTIIGALMFNFALWTSEVGYYFERPFCAPMHKYYSLVSSLNNVDTLITLIIPTILIITSNIRIGYAVAKFYRNRVRLQGVSRLEMLGDEHYAASLDDPRGIYANSSYNRLQMRVTKMLLMVSTVFLLCHIPSHGFRVYVFIMSLTVKQYQPSHMILLIQKLFNYLYYMNFSMNLFLYNISGKTFRNALMRLCRILHTRMSVFIRHQYSELRKSRTRSRSAGSLRSDLIRMRTPAHGCKCSHNINMDKPCKECEKYS